MNFNLKKPCANCPFRTNIAPFLRRERAIEIALAISDGDQSFPCHKTLSDSGGEDELVQSNKSEHCAGALIFLEKQENPNQMMRIMERLGAYDRHALEMDSPVFDSLAEFTERHRHG